MEDLASQTVANRFVVGIDMNAPDGFRERWHFNFYRTYDPSTGRYLEPDPLGLWAGVNIYAYARNLPSEFIDPLGLASLTTVMDPDRGTTTFDPRPEDASGSPYTIVTNNEVTSSALPGADDPFSTPDSDPTATPAATTNPRAYGPCCVSAQRTPSWRAPSSC